MIVTVTMNPAIDKTIELGALRRGGVNRIQKTQCDAGGKGVNVSKTLKALGKDSVACGFLAGSAGAFIERALEAGGIACDFVYTDGETRTNTKLIEADGSLTELNETGPDIPREKLQELMDRLEAYAREGTLFVLSGSVPASVGQDIYAKIIRMAHQRGAAVLADASGELLAQAAAEGPDILKPNLEELRQFLRIKKGVPEKRELSEAELLEAVRFLSAGGTREVVLTMGDQGALFFLEGRFWRCPALPVKACSALGAGDAAAAAAACAWEKGLGPEETARLCMAVSAAAVEMPGSRPPLPETVEALKRDVICRSV